MSVRDLRKLSRKELLEMLIIQGKELESLQKKVEEQNAELENRTLKVRSTGSLAEAVLRLNGVAEATDRAAEQYLESVRSAQENLEAERGMILAQARKQADAILEKAERERRKKLEETDRRIEELNARICRFYEEHPDIEVCFPWKGET